MTQASRCNVAKAPLSANAFAIVAALVEARTGQQIAENRIWRVETALQPLLRHSGAKTLDDLVTRLVSGGDPALLNAVIEAILNNETSFFRDALVLDAIVDAAEVLSSESPGRRLRIWSAGCSTGQEPYSLAILFSERECFKDGAFPEIIATDISAHALKRASAARFSQFEIQRGMPIRRMVAWFGNDDNDWVASPDLVRRVSFRRHNLVMDAPPAGKFDIILCRNLLFYFSPERRQQVFDRLAHALNEDGILILGAGETVIGQARSLAPSDRFRGFYRRAPANGDTAT